MLERINQQSLIWSGPWATVSVVARFGLWGRGASVCPQQQVGSGWV